MLLEREMKNLSNSSIRSLYEVGNLQQVFLHVGT